MKNVNRRIKKFEYEKLIYLFLFSTLIAIYWTLNDPSTYSSEQACYSTSHGYFFKYKYFLDNKNSSLIFPEGLTSLDSFSYSRIVIELFSKFSDSLCSSSLFLRFNCHLFPLIGASIIYNRVFQCNNRKFYYLFSFLSLSVINIFLKIPFPPANFNYPLLSPFANYNSHLNGNLTTSFCMFLFPALLIIKKSKIRKIILFIGGFFNPIITSLFSLCKIFSEKNIKNKINKSFLLKIFIDFIIPYISYISSKFIWNLSSNIGSMKNILFISQEELDPSNYLKFVDLVDFHRNRYSDLFYDLISKIFSLINSNTSDFDSILIDKSSILISYTGYIIFCVLFILIINSKYVSWSLSIENIIKKYIKLANPLVFSLLVILPLDFFIKFFGNSPSINLFNLLVLYNQLYIARFITLLFTVLFFVSIIFIFLISFEVVKSLYQNFSFSKNA